MNEGHALNGVLLAVIAVFLSRLLAKLDRVYDAVVGTTERPGLVDRVVRIELHTGLADAPALAERPSVDERRSGVERRQRPR